MVLYSAFAAVQAMIGEVMKGMGLGNLGFYCTAVFYIAMSLTCLGATAIVNKLGARRGVFVGSLSFGLYCGGGLIPSLRDSYDG